MVEDTARHDVTDTPQPEVYSVVSRLADAPSQQRILASDLLLVVRSADDPRALVPSLRAIVQEAAPAAPLESIMTMRDRVADSLSRPRLYAVLLGTFAVFALAIAGVGLFGVLSYSVAQRAREIGVRTALGAQMRDIIGLVVGQSMAIAGAGLAAGLVASFWLTRRAAEIPLRRDAARRRQLRRRGGGAPPRLGPRQHRPRPPRGQGRSGESPAS